MEVSATPSAAGVGSCSRSVRRHPVNERLLRQQHIDDAQPLPADAEAARQHAIGWARERQRGQAEIASTDPAASTLRAP